MQPTATNENQISLVRVAYAAAAIILLALFHSLYDHRHNSYALTPTPPVTITNPAALQQWMPNSVYRYTVARLDDYLASQGKPDARLAVYNDAVTVDPHSGSYSFSILVSGEKFHKIKTLVTSQSGVFSYSLTVDNKTQSPQVLTKYGSASFVSFDALTNIGFTALQTENLQKALLTFSPKARTIELVDGNITNQTINDLNVTTLKFQIYIDGQTYAATTETSDPINVTITLKDTAKQTVLHRTLTDPAFD